MSRRARERANARPWEHDPEPEDHQHAGDFPERDDDEQPERCPNTDDMFDDQRTSTCQHASTALK